ncbi:hypothetical protein RDWZM_004369 [Blomia tropicalis]|uniref:AGRL2-4 GAIN subdomain A domain-containing protein n=1 Tax=Blomia tropicalis TaxID=40697 RepID=A0A9Q0MHB6_BLOTA|nr:hypothetical protein RDWZM_004369 [Blomia tropicalis]
MSDSVHQYTSTSTTIPIFNINNSNNGRTEMSREKNPMDINQDLLERSNYLNIECNQPEHNNGMKCKQMEDHERTQSISTVNIDNNNDQQLTGIDYQLPMSTTLTSVTMTTTSTSTAMINHDAEQTSSQNRCQSIRYRDIEWPSTNIGSIVTRSCPAETSGEAQWQCGNRMMMMMMNNQIGEPMWNKMPDLSRCVSRWLLELHSFQNVNNFRNDIWKSILNQIQHQRTLYGGDLVELNTLLHQSLQHLIDRHDRVNLHQHSIAFETLFETVSFMLDDEMRSAWFDLPETNREVVALYLLDFIAKNSILSCLDRHQSNGDHQWKHLVISCFSITKMVQHQQQKQANMFGNLSQEFKFKLLNSNINQHSSWMEGSAMVSLVTNGANIALLLNDDISFATIIVDQLENYFRQNENHSLLLLDHIAHPQSMESNDLSTSTMMMKPIETIINSNVVKLVRFNSSTIVSNHRTMTKNIFCFEITFKHTSIVEESMNNIKLNMNVSIGIEWSNDVDQCWMIDGNRTHSTCRCNLVSACSIITNRRRRYSPDGINSDNRSTIASLFDKEDSILSLALIFYMWLLLLLARCHNHFFIRFNSIPLIMTCMIRTNLELILTTEIIWPNWISSAECHLVILFLIGQMQLIVSLLSVYIFQNAILVVLCSRIYLSKNYQNSLQALNRSRNLQFVIITIVTIVQFGSISLIYDRDQICHLRLNGISRFSHFMVVSSPIIHILLVVATGIIYLHCSQKVFSDYGYPSLNFIHLETNLMEKHVKNLFRERCSYGTLWIGAIILFLIATLTPFTLGIGWSNPSISMIGLDIGLVFAFLLLARRRYASILIDRCLQSSNVDVHCSNDNKNNLSSSSKESGSIIRDNSISILSDTSKTFLTLPNGPISKIMDQQQQQQHHQPLYQRQPQVTHLQTGKVYPSPHRSSISSMLTAYDCVPKQTNPSSHVYESPKHLYKYEHDRYLFRNGTTTATTMQLRNNNNSTSRNNLYTLRLNSHHHHLLQQQQQSSFEHEQSTMNQTPTHQQQSFYGLEHDPMNIVPMRAYGTSHLTRQHRIDHRDNFIVPN